ncbi:LacI family DNA-binding transcriptional regulator [Pleomorphomonas carboxyditropha]|uniref:HTH lacI-type domain-containing protein n=1 Tax=Pleomorphomonas carboxyditropha TaxID=2023338 RepID=A0A2G9WP71_9HYPH|nr:LacI family DNA-binding transcriptional regulator [Pleomorphomonas carboxyditropha]PIO96521.1 hypothetical protein CJ014_24810 [Pleomorphomonas carboxyditropha]
MELGETVVTPPDPNRSASTPMTLDEVAAATGFSRTTVRFVVNGQAERYRIKAQTREQIEQFIREHGIVIDRTARSLRLQRSDAIGLVLPDLANPFFAHLTAALEDLCHAAGLVLLTTSSHDDPAGEARAVTRLLERGVDGMVIAPCSPRIALPPSGGRRSCAVVMTDRAFPGQPYPVVVTDNQAAGHRLADILLAERGDAVFLAASRWLPSVEERIRGFVAACAEHGLEDGEARVFSSESDDVAAGRRLMTEAMASRGGLPKAFVCSSLLVFEGALEAIGAQDGRLPPDMLLGTFDHHPLLDFLPNRIVSARQDEKAIAETIFRCLTDQLEGKPPRPERLVIDSRIWRNSDRT